jgi:thiamine-phosphate pyrophosphorylase
MSSLAEARLYLVSPARIRGGFLADFVVRLAQAGVDLIQLREKEMEAGDVLRSGEHVAAACRDAGVDLVVNDRPDIALALQAAGVHLGQNDVPVWVARRILGTAIVGRSTHLRSEIDSVRTTSEPIDYIAVGPVYETPTKPGRPAAGLELVRYAASKVSLPWFAIGGINEANLDEVMDAGARRVVVVRAITEAADPVAAAGALRERLEQRALD